ncbi:MAG: Ureidoglycine aminohydrolase [uncultured Truepera sp.]|uniref:Ureidoglycine aminohydrolase n=1 Tax=uncultured Truepera sp. TaxID=543023 RepID=A0A6J4VNU4_9DEIN|nr:MAG: Ureidoglycine aminohydrolase [uncultured Truepera sp.]
MTLPRTFTALGETRTRLMSTHALFSPDGHVRTQLPGWTGTACVVLISAQLGARFTQYFAHMEAGGQGAATGYERFVFVLSGAVRLELALESSRTLTEYGYTYLPAGSPATLHADAPATLCVFERRYLPLRGVPAPAPVFGNERDTAGEAFLGDDGVTLRKLLPEHPSFDLMLSTMTFAPGRSLPFAETHVMEHGLLLLSGGGVYRLADLWYPVTAGDTIYMAPYCPQWFGALGRVEAKYLLYKDAFRDPFALAEG